MAVTTNEGKKYAYRYTNDNGQHYRVTLDEQIAAAGSFTPAQAGDLPMPKRFQMRRVYYRTPSGRKGVIPVALVVSALWSDLPLTVDNGFNGEAYTTTGRRGEKMSYGPPPAPSPSPSPSP